MEFLRSWVRATAGALGASLLVPGAVIVVAAGVAIGGGGLGGIAALGQLVEGPRAPLGQVATPAGADTLAGSTSTLIATAGEAAGTAGPGGGSGEGGPGEGGPGEDGPGAGEGPDGDGNGGGDNGGGGGGGGTPPGGGGGGGGGGTTEPPPEEPPSALDQLGDATEPVTDELPAPVGPLTGDAIDQVVELGEQLLGEPGSGESVLGLLPR